MGLFHYNIVLLVLIYSDQRAQLELAVDKVIQVMKHRQLLTIDRPEREEMTMDEVNEVIRLKAFLSLKYLNSVLMFSKYSN